MLHPGYLADVYRHDDSLSGSLLLSIKQNAPGVAGCGHPGFRMLYPGPTLAYKQRFDRPPAGR